jgi:hypothetical protein
VTSLASPGASLSHTSSISASLAPSPPPSAAPLGRGPGTTLFVPDATSVAAFRDARYPIFLLCRAALVASAFFVHLLLNAMCFPLQLRQVSSV